MVKGTHLKATRAMFAAPVYDVLRITPIALSFYSLYSSVVMKKARANPKVVTRPTCLPPYLKASGIMVSANIVKSAARLALHKVAILATSRGGSASGATWGASFANRGSDVATIRATFRGSFLPLKAKVLADPSLELVIYVIVIVVVRSILGLILGSRNLYPALLFVHTRYLHRD